MKKHTIKLLLLLIAAPFSAMAQTPDMLVVNKIKSNGNFPGNLAFIDSKSGKILKTIPVGNEPHEVAISTDKKYALVTNTGSYREPSNTLSLIDIAQQKELRRIDLVNLWNPHGAIYHKGLFYFTAEGSRAIGAYDPEKDQLAWINGTGQDQTHMLVITEDGKHIVAANRGSGTVSIYNLQGDSPLKGGAWKHTIVPVGESPEGVALSPDGTQAWIGLRRNGEIAIVDIANKKVIEKFDVPEIGGIARLAFTLDGKYVVAAGSREGNAVIVDTKTHKTVKNYQLGAGTEPVFIHPDGKYAYIGTTNENFITEIDLTTLEITRKLTGFEGPDAMAWIGGVEGVNDNKATRQGRRQFFNRTLPVSPEVHPDNTVTFRIDAPKAKEVSVQVSGSKPVAMTREADGVWSVTTSPLSPDVYPYSFTVDGLSVPDPVNPEITSGYQMRVGSSLVEVPAKTPEPWEQTHVPHGAVTRHFYRSAVIGEQSDVYVYTPPGYDPKRKQKYPTLYLLHGLTENAESWFTAGKANFILDNLIAQGKVAPMLIVCPLGYGDPKNITQGYGGAFETFTKSLLTEVVPFVEANYNVGKKAEDRAITGLSMGAGQSLFIGLNNPDQFAYVGGFSSAVVMYGMNRDRSTVQQPELLLDAPLFRKVFPALDADINKKNKLLWIATGDGDGEFAFSMEFKLWLKSIGVEFDEIITPGQHTWMVWKRNLVDFSQLLFK